MKILYIECNMGAAGDMLMAALLELHPNPKEFLEKLNNIGLHGVNISSRPSVKCGINGTHIKVLINGKEENETMHDHNHNHNHNHDHDHSHQHNQSHTHNHTHNHNHSHNHSHSHQHHHNHNHGGMADIEHKINHLYISDTVKKNAIGVYNLIAQAESQAHGTPISQVHFHEVGEMDAIADIVGVCMLIDELSPDRIMCSPIHVGSGQVKCSHGILPVPAPATAFILKDIPIYSGNILSELCTPTGAAILKYFSKDFCPMPAMKVSKIGYGMGKKDFEIANMVRTYIGESATSISTSNNDDIVIQLSCNLDDMTPEAISFAQQTLFDEGALDVFTTPIGMKKGRLGILFTCMCKNEQIDKFIKLIFKHTSTIGIRKSVNERFILKREIKSVETKHGAMKVKISEGYGITKCKPEYDDITKTAKEKNISFADVLKEL